MNDPSPLLIDVREAARLLAISQRTLWSMTQSGEVPSVRVGRRVLYRPESLQKWVEEQERARQPADNQSVEAETPAAGS